MVIAVLPSGEGRAMKKKVTVGSAKKKTNKSPKKIASRNKATSKNSKAKKSGSMAAEKVTRKPVKKAAAKKPIAKKATTKKTTVKTTTARKKVTPKTISTKVASKTKVTPQSPLRSAASKVKKVITDLLAPKELERASPSLTAPTAPLPMVRRPIGVVTHYYSHLGVAVVQLNEGTVRVGETIHIKGFTTDLKQPVESIEIDHQSMPEASKGQIFGLKVRDHVREHDQIYRPEDS